MRILVLEWMRSLPDHDAMVDLESCTVFLQLLPEDELESITWE
jgi:hypothetical protein